MLGSKPAPPVVLTIEDSPLVRQMVAGALDGLHIALLEAASGAEGIRMIVQHRPALVLLDVMLPDVDGVTLLQQLRRLPDAALAATPVVVLTSVNERSVVEALVQAGAAGYLLKPFALTDLRARVVRLLPAAATRFAPTPPASPEA